MFVICTEAPDSENMPLGGSDLLSFLQDMGPLFFVQFSCHSSFNGTYKQSFQDNSQDLLLFMLVYTVYNV